MSKQLGRPVEALPLASAMSAASQFDCRSAGKVTRFSRGLSANHPRSPTQSAKSAAYSNLSPVELEMRGNVSENQLISSAKFSACACSWNTSKYEWSDLTHHFCSKHRDPSLEHLFKIVTSAPAHFHTEFVRPAGWLLFTVLEPALAHLFLLYDEAEVSLANCESVIQIIILILDSINRLLTRSIS